MAKFADLKMTSHCVDVFARGIPGWAALALEFETYAPAKACYEDPAYTEAKAFALRASKRQLIIIEGDLA